METIYGPSQQTADICTELTHNIIIEKDMHTQS